MTRPAATTLLLLASFPLAPSLAAQATATATHRSSTTHRSATAAKPAAPPANPADNPPGVPPVTGTPKVLYALRYIDIKVGDGPLAPPQKFYTVKYTGWLTDGTKFDSSDDHPGQEPITFAYGAHRVIPGWDTGFEGMHVGGKRRLYIPYQLAYGIPGREGAIPPKADLIFDVELVSFADSPAPPSPPPAAPSEPGQNSAQPGQNPSDPGQKSTPPATPPAGNANPN